jgi:vacuolar-type H+-ATPase subunit C/Vma6
MKQCGSLAELKTFLEETDYSSFIQGGDAELPIPILR